MNEANRISRLVRVGILLAAAALAGCASARPVEPGESVGITLGPDHKTETIEIEAHKYKLSLEQIVDSRCPANAKCIWAGELAARIEVERTDRSAAAREITLGEASVPSTEVFGMKLTLLEIDETSVTFSVAAAEEP